MVCRFISFLNPIILWTAMFLSSCYSSYIVNNFKQYGNKSIEDDQFLTFVGSCGLLCSVVGCLLWIPIFGCFGFRISYCIVLALQILVAVTIPIVRLNRDMYMIWILISFALHGAHQPVVYMPYWDHLYGPRFGGILSTIIFIVIAVGNLLNWSIADIGHECKLNHFRCLFDCILFYRWRGIHHSSRNDYIQLIIWHTFSRWRRQSGYKER